MSQVVLRFLSGSSSFGLAAAIACLAMLLLSTPLHARDVLEECGTLAEEQAKEKIELGKMRAEMNDINGTINGAMSELDKLNQKFRQGAQAQVREFHLFAREADWTTYPGHTVHCLTYNGKLPGPTIRVKQGDPVKIVLHNQLKTSTSLYFHGMKTPHEVSGLPRKGHGMINPGKSFAFQFVAGQPGTYWYHPQIIHARQKLLGLYGIIVVEPRLKSRQYDRDITLLLSQLRTRVKAAPVRKPKVRGTKKASKSTTFKKWEAVATPSSPDTAYGIEYLVNGKQAPSIPPVELRKGDRVRLRIINAGSQMVPLHLSGHKLEVVATNGGDRLEPHVFRDNITLGPSDRMDVEFTANNPGVWSLGSELYHQATRQGKFPGGMAMVVRYSQLKARQGNSPLAY